MCQQIHRLALKHFHQPTIAAACVAFFELLGQDSSGLRIDLQVSTLILSHRASQLQGPIEQRRQAEAKLQVQLGNMSIQISPANLGLEMYQHLNLDPRMSALNHFSLAKVSHQSNELTFILNN